MYMDDIRLFAKNEKEWETLIHAVRIYNQDIGIEFGMEKCTMQVMKIGKRALTGWMKLPNEDKTRTAGEKETYKYLGILGVDTINQEQMKEKVKKGYSRQKLYSRNLIKGINTWAVPHHKIFGTILEVDQRT